MTTCARPSRAATATRSPGTSGSSRCAATTPFTRRPARRRRRARRAPSRAPSGTSRRGSGRRGGSRSLADLDEQYADWRDRVCNRRRHATGGFWVDERLEHRARGAAAAAADRLRLRRPARDAGAAGRLPQARRQLLPGAGAAGSSARRAALRPRPRLDRASRPDRRPLPRAATTAAAGSRRRGCGPSRHAPTPVLALTAPGVAPPELADYAELCA